MSKEEGTDKQSKLLDQPNQEGSIHVTYSRSASYKQNIVFSNSVTDVDAQRSPHINQTILTQSEREALLKGSSNELQLKTSTSTKDKDMLREESDSCNSTRLQTPSGTKSRRNKQQQFSGASLIDQRNRQIGFDSGVFRERKTCFGLTLQQGINGCNLTSVYTMQFCLFMNLQVQLTLIYYLVEEISPDADVGQIVGNLGFYSDLTLIVLDLLLGSSMDIFGRKGVSLVGFALASLALTMMPSCHEVYPGLLICRLLLAIGLLPASNSPFIIDYVDQASLGKAYAQINMISLLAQLLGTSGAIQVTKIHTVRILFYVSGGLTFLSTIFLLFGLKEAHKSKYVRADSLSTTELTMDGTHRKKDLLSDTNESIPDRSVVSQRQSKASQCVQITKVFCQLLSTRKALIVSMLGNFCTMVAIVAGYQFGAIVYYSEYQKAQEAQDFVANKLSLMYLISLLLSFPLSTLYGVLCDKIQVWKILLINCLVIILASSTFVWGTQTLKDQLPLPPHQLEGSYIQDSGFVLINILSICQFQLNWTLMSKGLNGSNQSVGVCIGAFSIFGSLGSITANKIGGSFFDANSVTVFYLCIASYMLLTTLILTFALCKSLDT